MDWCLANFLSVITSYFVKEPMSHLSHSHTEVNSHSGILSNSHGGRPIASFNPQLKAAATTLDPMPSTPEEKKNKEKNRGIKLST